MKRMFNKPMRRVEYMDALIRAYKDDWKERYDVSKTDIREMSLRSLKKLYYKVGNDNFLRLGGGE